MKTPRNAALLGGALFFLGRFRTSMAPPPLFACAAWVEFSDGGEHVTDRDYVGDNIKVRNGTHLVLDGGFKIAIPSHPDLGADAINVLR
jgi:hypothetical protein